MKFYPVFLFLVIAIASIRCSDETIQSKTYPYVITKPVSVLVDGATFTADMLDLGTVPIKKYGFIVTDPEQANTRSFILAEPAMPSLGEYSVTLRAGLQKDHEYHVRAYAETENHVVLGNLEAFTGRGSLPPKILSFSPQEGPVGTVVEINGENIGLIKSGLVVRFGETEAVIDTLMKDRIRVKVPFISENRTVSISIQAGGQTSTSSEQFDVWFPWTRKADFPGLYLWMISSFESDGKIFVLGGSNHNPWQIENEFWVYDPEFDTWTQKSPFPGAVRYDATAFSCNGKGYYGLGRADNQLFSDFWEYDPESDDWNQKKSFPGTLSGSPRSFTVQEKGYVGTVLYTGGAEYQSKFWEYNPLTNQWTQKEDFPFGRYYGLSLGGSQKGYLGAGTAGWRLDDIYEYDPVADSWTMVGNYPGQGNNDVGSFFIDGNIYMGMGSDNSTNSYSDFWEFDIVHQSWKQMQPCPTKLSPFISITIGNKGYIGYGWYDLSSYDSYYGRSFYEFDPSRN